MTKTYKSLGSHESSCVLVFSGWVRVPGVQAELLRMWTILFPKAHNKPTDDIITITANGSLSDKKHSKFCN